MPRATVLKPQSYETFIYKSTGSQTGNRYNSWSDLMTAITKQEGFKLIIFEQSETIPAGAWNLDYCTLGGNGLAYDSGGFTATFPTGVTISSWLGPQTKVDYGLKIRSTSNAAIYSTSSSFSMNLEKVSAIGTTTAPFITFSGSGQIILNANSSSRILNDGYEVVEVTSSAMAAQVILSWGSAGVAIQSNVMRSTNNQLFLQVLQTSFIDAGTYPSTQANMNIGFELDLNFGFAANITYNPTSNDSGDSPVTVTRTNSFYAADASGGAITYNLMAATGSGIQLYFKKIDSSANAVTIDGSGSETIDGATTYVLYSQYDSISIIDAASGVWYIL